MKKIFVISILSMMLLMTDTSSAYSQKATVANTAIQTADKSKDTTLACYRQFEALKGEVIKKLQKTTPKKANQLYLSYLKENRKIIDCINREDSWYTDNFYSLNEISSKVMTAKESDMDRYGLYFWELGEGDVEIRTQPYFYYNIFAKYVTADFYDYLKILREEDAVLYEADAGLSISFEDLGERIVVWEGFLRKHPNTALLKNVLERYFTYQIDYLLGMDNTPTAEYDEESEAYIFTPETLAEFTRFLRKYPDSPTTELIEFFMKNFDGKAFAKEESIYIMLNMLKTKQKQLFDSYLKKCKRQS